MEGRDLYRTGLRDVTLFAENKFFPVRQKTTFDVLVVLHTHSCWSWAKDLVDSEYLKKVF